MTTTHCDHRWGRRTCDLSCLPNSTRCAKHAPEVLEKQRKYGEEKRDKANTPERKRAMYPHECYYCGRANKTGKACTNCPRGICENTKARAARLREERREKYRQKAAELSQILSDTDSDSNEYANITRAIEELVKMETARAGRPYKLKPADDYEITRVKQLIRV